ncbi:SPEF2-like protein [Mya arenaria]|uniref:SPEF2-like protein n=1 Tax=Mya arenaria TaxID=6604 RepID=A0ABY7FU52_MYAAR|nr:SPEF2-like protein [Mya arenaria]
MTDILCRWLNDELKVSQRADPTTFERDFASGFLIGEVLEKYQLQNDFDKFSQSKTSDSKLNNFTRIEPTLHLLAIPFDTNVARAIMTETHGVATRLMYQLYIALTNKKKSNLTGVAMETMRPAAPAKLNAVESGIYKDRLKHMTPRQSDLELQDVVNRFHEKQIEMEKVAFRERFLEQERIREQQQKERKLLIDRARAMKLKQSEMDTVRAISDFEERMKLSMPPTKDDDDEGIEMEYLLAREDEKSDLENADLIKPRTNDEYIGKIRKRLQEDSSARAEREKRRRKVIVDQIKAHEAQEEAHREEMLVNRLMRQSQQERRIAVQLLQARHEKEVIRKNRILREQMYEERRRKDFEEAMNREAEMARLAKQEYEEQTQMDKELHDKIAAERAEAKYRRHYEMCQGVVDQIVDFSGKVAEYRELTNNLVPAKLMRDWRAQFEAGIPLYEKKAITEDTGPTPEQVIEEERLNLLDEGDFIEYKNMVGEWQPPEGSETIHLPRDNPIEIGEEKSSAETQNLDPSSKLTNIQIKIRAPTGEGLNTPVPLPEVQAPKEDQNEAGEGRESQQDVTKEEPKSSRKTPVRSKQPKELPTPRAKLGAKAQRFLKKGQAVDDQVLVDILVESIRRVPEGTGWVIDGFPMNYAQAKMLEKALSGYDAAAKSGKGPSASKQKKSVLAPDPRPPPTPVDPASGIDVVIMITGFLDSWPKLEKWFTKFGTLQKVDASLPSQSVQLEVEKILEDTLNRLQGKDQESSQQPVEQTETVEEKKEEILSILPLTVSSGKKGSRSSSKESRSKSPKDKDKKRDKSGSPKRGASPKKSDSGSGKKSRGASPKSKKGSGKKGKTPEPEPEPVPEEPTGPPPPQPGSEEWEFVDQELEKELAKILADHWEAVEKMYIQDGKFVFRKIRDERENIYRYFFQIRKDYLAYLRRPDHKQEFEYNDVPDDMREDEETKMELHQRVDDLRERLWNICDERKEQAESERETVINDGWLDDRLGVLSNFYITLMQTEVDRFQDTVRMMKDYYRGMEGEIPDELNVNYIRLPLIELPVERPESPEKAGSEGRQTPTPDDRPGTGKSDRPRSKSPRSPKGGRSKSPREKSPKGSKSRSRTPSAKKRDKSKEKEKPAEITTLPTPPGKRIPLIPRRPTSADIEAKSKEVAKTKDKKKKDDGYESPVPPTDPDEKLIFDAFQMGVTNISTIKEAAAAALATKAKPKGKGKKSRSPSPKKGGKGKEEGAPTPVPSEPVSEDEQQRRDVRDRMKQEYFFSIAEEEKACKTRMELVKVTAMAVMHDLKNKADEAFKDMNDWLGARYLKEMESIDHMSEIVRNAIESKMKIKQELMLKQQEFLMNEDLAVLKTPSPPPPEKEIETPTSDCFTVAQLMNLFAQFATTAPTGVMSNKSFLETFENMIQDIANGCSSDNEYVDWRRFLIALAQPIPTPTQSNLLETLGRFKEMDQKSTGFVTREQYDRMDLWFSPSDSNGYNRLSMLKASLFDIFANHGRIPPVVDYIGMLLYFSAAGSSQEGFMRALSVSAGTHMPRLLKSPPKPQDILSPEIPEDLEDVSPMPPPEDIPSEAIDAVVPLDALYRVLHHGETPKGDSHRYSVTADPEDATSRERLASVYQELGNDNLESVPFKVLVEHPLIQDVINACKTFKSLDLKTILSSSDNMDATSTKTGE